MMRSATLPSFWEAYKELNPDVRGSTRKAYALWSKNPFHPSLQFKCINRAENLWSIRITLNYRALGILQKDTVTWFWIGNHEGYKRFIN